MYNLQELHACGNCYRLAVQDDCATALSESRVFESSQEQYEDAPISLTSLGDASLRAVHTSFSLQQRLKARGTQLRSGRRARSHGWFRERLCMRKRVLPPTGRRKHSKA